MTTHDDGRLVDNVTLRRAVGQFAAHPSQRGALDVPRECMYGDLLLDVTGSDAFTADPPFAAGSRLQIRTGTGPNGASALYAFTHNHEIGRLQPPGTRTQSLVTPAVGALELARQQDHAWLYINPAGPTCPLSAAEIDFALRNPHNPGRSKKHWHATPPATPTGPPSRPCCAGTARCCWPPTTRPADTSASAPSPIPTAAPAFSRSRPPRRSRRSTPPTRWRP